MHSRRFVRIVSAAAGLVLATGYAAEGAQKVSGSGYGFYVRKTRDMFKLSDQRSNFFAFLRCSRDHHSLNFLQVGNHAGLHHVAFEL